MPWILLCVSWCFCNKKHERELPRTAWRLSAPTENRGDELYTVADGLRGHAEVCQVPVVLKNGLQERITVQFGAAQKKLAFMFCVVLLHFVKESVAVLEKFVCGVCRVFGNVNG
jgi:hypothetical protein